MYDRKETEEYLNLKMNEISETKEILKEYICKKKILIKKQEALELHIIDSIGKSNFGFIESKKEELNACLMDLFGVIKEISYYENLLSDLEYDLDMCNNKLRY